MSGEDINLNRIGDNLLGNPYNSSGDIQANSSALNLQAQPDDSARGQDSFMFELAHQNQNQRGQLDRSMHLSFLQQNSSRSSGLPTSNWPDAHSNEAKQNFNPNLFTDSFNNPSKENPITSKNDGNIVSPHSTLNNFNLNMNPGFNEVLSFNSQSGQIKNNQLVHTQNQPIDSSGFNSNSFTYNPESVTAISKNQPYDTFQNHSLQNKTSHSPDSQSKVLSNSNFQALGLRNLGYSNDSTFPSNQFNVSPGSIFPPQIFDNLGSGGNIINKDYNFLKGDFVISNDSSTRLTTSEDNNNALKTHFPKNLDVPRRPSNSSSLQNDRSPHSIERALTNPRILSSDSNIFNQSEMKTNLQDISDVNSNKTSPLRSNVLGVSNISIDGFRNGNFNSANDISSMIDANRALKNNDQTGATHHPAISFNSNASFRTNPSTPLQSNYTSFPNIHKNVNDVRNDYFLGTQLSGSSKPIDSTKPHLDLYDSQNSELMNLLGLRQNNIADLPNGTNNDISGNPSLQYSSARLSNSNERSVNSVSNTTANSPVPKSNSTPPKTLPSTPVSISSNKSNPKLKPKPKAKSKSKPKLKSKKNDSNSLPISSAPEKSNIPQITSSAKLNQNNSVSNSEASKDSVIQEINSINFNQFPKILESTFNRDFINNASLHQSQSFSDIHNISAHASDPNSNQATQILAQAQDFKTVSQNHVPGYQLNNKNPLFKSSDTINDKSNHLLASNDSIPNSSGVSPLKPRDIQSLESKISPNKIIDVMNAKNNPISTDEKPLDDKSSKINTSRQPQSSLQYLMNLSSDKFNQIVESLALKIQKDSSRLSKDNYFPEIELPNLDPFGVDMKKIFYSVIYHGGLDRLKGCSQQQQFQIWGLIARSLANNQGKPFLQPQNIIQIYRKWLYPLEAVIRDHNKKDLHLSQTQQMDTTHQSLRENKHDQFPSHIPDQLYSKLISQDSSKKILSQSEQKIQNSDKLPQQLNSAQNLQAPNIHPQHQINKSQQVVNNEFFEKRSANSLQSGGFINDKLKYPTQIQSDSILIPSSKPDSINSSNQEVANISDKNNTKIYPDVSQNVAKSIAKNNQVSSIQDSSKENSKDKVNLHSSKNPPVKLPPEKRKITKKPSRSSNSGKSTSRGSPGPKKAKLDKKRSISTDPTTAGIEKSNIKSISSSNNLQELVGNHKFEKLEIESYVPLERDVETFGGIELKSAIYNCKPQLPFSIQVYDSSYLNIHAAVMSIRSGYSMETSLALNNLLVASTNPSYKIILRDEIFLFDTLIDFLTKITFDTYDDCSENDLDVQMKLKPSYFDCCRTITECMFDVNFLKEDPKTTYPFLEKNNSLDKKSPETLTNHCLSNYPYETPGALENHDHFHFEPKSILEFCVPKFDQYSSFSDSSLVVLGIIRNLSCIEKENSIKLSQSKSFATIMIKVIKNLNSIGSYLISSSKGLITSWENNHLSLNQSFNSGSPSIIPNVPGKILNSHPHYPIRILTSLVENYKSWLEIMYSISTHIDLSRYSMELAESFLSTMAFFFNSRSLFPIFNLCPCTGIHGKSQNTRDHSSMDALNSADTEFSTLFSLILSGKSDPRVYLSANAEDETRGNGSNPIYSKPPSFVIGENLLLESKDHSCYYIALSLCCFGRLLLLESNRLVISKCEKNLLGPLIDTSISLINGCVSSLFDSAKNLGISKNNSSSLSSENRFEPKTENDISQTFISSPNPNDVGHKSDCDLNISLLDSPQLSLMWINLALFIVSNLFSVENLTSLESAYGSHTSSKPVLPISDFYNHKDNENFLKSSHFSMPFLISNDIPAYVDNISELKTGLSDDVNFIRSLISMLFACFYSYTECVQVASKTNTLNLKGKGSTSSINSKSEISNSSTPEYWINLSERIARLLFSLRLGKEHMFHSIFESYVVNRILLNPEKVPKHFIKMLYELVSPPRALTNRQ
ncbi:hypothetical protein AYI68_g5325 [Smittium mucronatum]|uniref:ARID domain-containing protein n=1 Tax=Smittium mucronatum TaxID=133383 RepID=A0A1R0GUM3_9FUNG|nr:hypothetical protein AYI68_g5325 [Smittium mucronatum]